MNPIDTAAYMIRSRCQDDEQRLDDKFFIVLRKQIMRQFRLTWNDSKRIVLAALNEHRGRAYNGQVEFRKTYY